MEIGFIGIGKIATAVIEGLCTSDIGPSVLRLSPRNEENSKRLAEKYAQVMRMKDNQSVIDQSDIVFLALRPPQAPEILKSLRFRANQHIVSLIPLIRVSELEKILVPGIQICRAIPLPPVVNHNCPIPVFNAPDLVVELLNKTGQTISIQTEDQLHALWTLTCLITPYYDLLNELSEWTVLHGVGTETANRYIADLFQSLSFTAQIANPIHFNDLAQHAATPNGMNEQAGKEIRAKGAHRAYRDAADRILAKFPVRGGEGHK